MKTTQSLRRPSRQLLLGATLLVGALAAHRGDAQLNPFVVTNSADGGPYSLREALASGNPNIIINSNLPHGGLACCFSCYSSSEFPVARSRSKICKRL
jgi:hypothetical protein